MDTKILSKKENKVIGRIEAKAEIAYAGAPPKRAEIRDAIAKEMKVAPENVVISKIRNAFGMRKSAIKAHIYTDATVISKYEHNYKSKRIGSAKPEEKKEEAPAEKPAEEAPKEEAKEEPKEEVKEGEQ